MFAALGLFTAGAVVSACVWRHSTSRPGRVTPNPSTLPETQQCRAGHSSTSALRPTRCDMGIPRPVRMPPAIDSASHKCSSTFRGGLGLNQATIISAGPSCRCL